MRYGFVQTDLEKTNVAGVLESVFGSSLSEINRQHIVSLVKNHFSVIDLANEIEKLEFSRVIYTIKSYSRMCDLLGLPYTLSDYALQKWTPPGKIGLEDYVLNSGVYQRGAMTVHALRLKTGDDLFYKILRTYLERYKFSNASNQDFVNIVNELAGMDTKTFLEAWLYNDQVPDFPEMNLYAKDFQLGADFK